MLTSEPADATALEQRVGFVLESGCGGLVCAASDLSLVRRLAPEVVTVVPGIRPAGVGADDQARPATPAAAVAAGASVLVIGRAVTHAPDQMAAAAAIAAEVASAG